MGIKTFSRRIIIKEFLKRMPFMTQIFSWLKDPKGVARKRTVAVVAAVIAGAIRGAESILKSVCESGADLITLCRVDLSMVAGYLDLFVTALNTIVVPGADVVTILVGIWGLWAAKNKTAVVSK